MTKTIKNLVLSGGGAKGATYGGLVEALEIAKITPSLEKIAGTSAGSNIAAFLAVGISPDDLKEKVLEKDLRQYFGSGILGFVNDGTPLIDFVNNLLIDNIKRNIEEIDFSSANLTEEEKTQFETLKSEISAEGVENVRKITFGDLVLLRKFKPETFKNLYITAVSKDKKELRIFSTANEEDSNISIAEACRASSLLPLLFKPAEINTEEFLDGGLRKNTPVDPFLKEGIEETIVITLEPTKDLNKNDVYKVLHGKVGENEEIVTASFFEKILFYIMRAFGLVNEDYFQSVEQEYRTMPQIPFSICNINTEGLTVTGFDAVKEMGEEKYVKGRLSTMEYLVNHDKLGHLSDTEYKTLVDKTRLQECFFKIITEAKLDRNSQLYKTLIEFCKDEKFKDCAPVAWNQDFTEVRQKFNDAYNAHQDWMKINQEYKAWEQSNEADKASKEPKDEAWEKAKEEYNKSQEAITEYNEQFKNVDYLKRVIQDFASTIANSNEHSSAKAKVKLQASFDKVIEDPYISSENVKSLFKGMKFVEQANIQNIGCL